MSNFRLNPISSLTAAVCVFMSLPALAATSSKPVQIDLPSVESESGADISDFTDPSYVPELRPSQVEVSASTWAPGSLSLPARASGVSSFRAGGTPMVGVGFLVPVGDSSRGVDLAFRTTVSAVKLERDGMASFTGPAAPTTQNMYILPIQFGIEARPKRLRWKWTGLYGGASLLPLLALTQRSAIDEGKTFFGLAGEVNLGVENSLGWVASALSSSSVMLEGHGSAGTLSGEIFKAVGVRAGLRVRL